jgi:hypothetical protein
MSNNLEGKVVVITGASSGLGKHPFVPCGEFHLYSTKEKIWKIVIVEAS